MSGGCTDEERGAPGLGRRPAHADDRRHAPHKFTAGHSPSWAQRWKSARVMLVPLVAVDGGESVPARDGVLLTRLMPNLASKGSALHGAGRTQEERRARRRRMQQKAEPATGGASRFWGGPCLRLRNEPMSLRNGFREVTRPTTHDRRSPCCRKVAPVLKDNALHPRRRCLRLAAMDPACRPTLRRRLLVGAHVHPRPPPRVQQHLPVWQPERCLPPVELLHPRSSYFPLA